MSTKTWGTFEHPFAATSPWNSRPVSPLLGTATVPLSAVGWYPTITGGAYSTGVFKAAASDGPVTINGAKDSDAEIVRPVIIPRWPANVVPATGGDGHAEVVDPVAGIVHSFYKLNVTDRAWTAALYSWSPLGGRGMGDPAHYYHGARASGVPTSGGLMRIAEINDGDTMYRHALAMSLASNGLDKGYVFPVTSTDGTSSTNTGKIPMGSLVMLPATFDAQALKTVALRKVAETLKTYGAYVVDRNTNTPYSIYVENGAGFSLHPPGGWSNTAAAELMTIRAALRPLASAGGWLDGDGNPFDLMAPMNLVSMRGGWGRTKGSVSGVFDTWRQALIFPPTTTPIEQQNPGGRAYTAIPWSAPVAGQIYRLKAVCTGGARFRMTLTDKTTKATLFDSGDMEQGNSMSFAWPAGAFLLSTYAKSGVGGVESTVSADLRRLS